MTETSASCLRRCHPPPALRRRLDRPTFPSPFHLSPSREDALPQNTVPAQAPSRVPARRPIGSGGGWAPGAQRRGWGVDVRAARWRHRGGYISEYRRRPSAPVTEPPPRTQQPPPLSPLASRRSVPPARLLPPPPSAGRFHRGKGIVSYVRYPEPPLFR